MIQSNDSGLVILPSIVTFVTQRIGRLFICLTADQKGFNQVIHNWPSSLPFNTENEQIVLFF